MKNKVIEVMAKIQAAIPVVWDRFTSNEGTFYVVYGWISRTDGQRDFLMLELMDAGEQVIKVSYVTSSAKYSEPLHIVLYGSADEHNSCRKIEELFTVD